MIITSAKSDRIKEIKKLAKSSSYRREKGVYIVEGIRMFREIPNDSIAQVYVAEGAYDKLKDDILAKISQEDIIFVSDHVFATMSETNTPQGILALVKISENFIKNIDIDHKTFILIAEHLQDPGNLGTIIRTAEGAGASGIVLSSDCVDLYNPKVIRSTMGSIFRVPVYVSQDLVSDINWLRSRGVCIFGAHLNGREFYDEDYSCACGFLIGNEGNGLSDKVSAIADKLIKIPMCGKVESLNAATSAAVIAYEVLRQRRA